MTIVAAGRPSVIWNVDRFSRRQEHPFCGHMAIWCWLVDLEDPQTRHIPLQIGYRDLLRVVAWLLEVPADVVFLLLQW